MLLIDHLLLRPQTSSIHHGGLTTGNPEERIIHTSSIMETRNPYVPARQQLDGIPTKGDGHQSIFTGIHNMPMTFGSSQQL